MTKHAAHSFDNPFEDPTDSDTDAAPAKPSWADRPGNPFEAPAENDPAPDVMTLVGRADGRATDPKPLLESRADEDLIEWMMGVGRFFAAAGVTLSRGAATPELLRSRNRALRWAMGFDILESTLRDDVREALKLDDDFHDAPDLQLIREANVRGEPEAAEAADAVYRLYGFTTGDDLAPDHLGRELLFYGLMTERLHAAGAEGDHEAVEALLTDAVDFLAQHLDWVERIPAAGIDPRHQLLLAVVRAVIRAERALTIE